MGRLKAVAAILFCGCAPGTLLAADDAGTPPRAPAADRASEARPAAPHELLSVGAIKAYRLVFAPARAQSPCAMHPSCSAFGLGAFKSHSLPVAWAMTADRLIRCGRDVADYRRVRVGDVLKLEDPVPGLDPATGEGPPATPVKAGEQVARCFPSASGEALCEENTSADLRWFCFARALHAQGDIARAVTEYRRFLFLTVPGSPGRLEAYRALLCCYYQLGEYVSTLDLGRRVLEGPLVAEERAEVRLLMAAASLDLDNAQGTREHVTEVLSTGSTADKDKARILEGLSYVREERWPDAARAFGEISSQSEFAEQAKAAALLAKGAPRLPRKNPTLAGLLGVVPGLGYLYDGYPRTALSAFIVNGLFIWATAEALHAGQDGLGTTLGVLGAGWYAGNVYGSVTSAQRKNAAVRRDWTLRFDVLRIRI